MKRIYDEPIFKVKLCNQEDIIRTSGEEGETPFKPVNPGTELPPAFFG